MAKLAWLSKPYVALNGKPNKLAQLIIEQGTSPSENKILAVNDTWDIGGGWTLTAQSIDAKSTPRQAWLVLSKDGVKIDDKVISQGQVYTYIEKNIAGESDVPLFVTYVDSVFAGATSDMVKLRYTWAISTNVTQIAPGNVYGVFMVIDDGTGYDRTIKLWNDASSVSLFRGSMVTLFDGLYFVVNDSPSLEYYPEMTGITIFGNDTIGIYRSSTSTFFLRNSNTAGFADIMVPYGTSGDTPVVGDWNGQ
jgi:S-layer protein (TIGR01567 family)